MEVLLDAGTWFDLFMLALVGAAFLLFFLARPGRP